MRVLVSMRPRPSRDSRTAARTRGRGRDGTGRGRGARAARRCTLRPTARRDRRGARGRGSRTSCAPGTPSPTIGYLFGTTRTCQPGASGSPGPTRATSGGVSASLPSQNGQLSTRTGIGACCTRNVSGRSARAGARITRSPVSSSTSSSCTKGQARARSRLPWTYGRAVRDHRRRAGWQHRGDRRGFARRRRHARRARHHRRCRAPLGLHPEQGDDRDGQRAHRARERPCDGSGRDRAPGCSRVARSGDEDGGHPPRRCHEPARVPRCAPGARDRAAHRRVHGRGRYR